MGKATRIVDWEKVWNAFDGNYATDSKVPGNILKNMRKSYFGVAIFYCTSKDVS